MADTSSRLTKKEQQAKNKEEKLKKQQLHRKKQRIRSILIVVGVLITVALCVLLVVRQQQTAHDSTEAPHKGSSSAPVHVIAYKDFECQACGSSAEVMKDIIEEYPDQIYFEFRHFPLPQHQFAIIAAVGAQCAHEQEKFFEYHDKLYHNQMTWMRQSTDEVYVTFRNYALDLDLDMTDFDACVSSPDAAERVNQDIALGTEQNISSTPTFFVNQERVTDVPFSSTLRAAIQNALQQE